MRLVTNSIEPTKVKETDYGWLIQDVPFVKPMELAGGYVPESSIKQTANKWSGRPPTLNHPRDETGKPIEASKKPELHLGTIKNTHYDGEFVRGDIQVNEADLVRLGGEALDIRRALEEGEPINVSSQYTSKELPPGQYDGEFRANVEKIVQPDSVALLPNKPAQCSVEDGCGINPELVANSGVSLTVADDPTGEDAGSHTTMHVIANQNVNYTTTDVTPEEVSSYTDEEWDGDAAVAAMPNPTESEDAAETLDETHMLVPTGDEARDAKANWKLPFRESADSPVNTRALVAIDAALSGARGGVEGVSSEDKEAAQELAKSFLVDAPDDLFGSIDAEDAEMDSAGTHMQENAAVALFKKALRGVMGDGAVDEPAESGADTNPTTNASGGGDLIMEREKLIEEITANSALTEESLTERCDDGLEAIHEDVTTNSEDSEPEESQGQSANTMEITESKLGELIEEKVEEVTANKQEETEKRELAGDIVANSAEYEDAESVLEDFPTKAALRAKKSDVTPSAGMPARGATTANAAGGEDEYPDPTFSGGD